MLIVLMVKEVLQIDLKPTIFLTLMSITIGYVKMCIVLCQSLEMSVSSKFLHFPLAGCVWSIVCSGPGSDESNQSNEVPATGHTPTLHSALVISS